MISIAENIKGVRTDKKLTQKEMAERLGMSVNGYQKIEGGENDINFSRLQQIADVFQMSVVNIIEYPNAVGTGQDSERVKELEGRVKELESKAKELELERENSDLKERVNTLIIKGLHGNLEMAKLHLANLESSGEKPTTTEIKEILVYYIKEYESALEALGAKVIVGTDGYSIITLLPKKRE